MSFHANPRQEREATSQGVGRPSIHMVNFKVNLKELEATLKGLGRPTAPMHRQFVSFEDPHSLTGDFFEVWEGGIAIQCTASNRMGTISLDIFLANYSFGQPLGKIS